MFATTSRVLSCVLIQFRPSSTALFVCYSLLASTPVRSFLPIRQPLLATVAPLLTPTRRSIMSSSPSGTQETSIASGVSDDPYTWLEEVEGEESLEFAKSANAKCLKALGDPTESDSNTYHRVLAVLESNDRIPFAGKFGVDENDVDLLYNFWKDSTNPKGLWRRCTLPSYCTESPEWTTVLNVDELAEKDGISWVWKGSTLLPRARDPLSGGKRVTRALLSLSRGGSDATHVKEFDLLTGEFVTENPFILPEAKTRASYKSRDVLLVGSDFGPDTLTDSGYPRTVREWVRGTELEDAPVVFQGDKKDVSVSAYIDDQRHHGGGIYERQSRSMTFYTSRYWVRQIQYEHLLAPDDPAREGVAIPGDFVELDVQEDADVDFQGNMMLITLRSDWEPIPGKVFKQGSIVYADASTFLSEGKEACDYTVLFEETERTAFESYSVTKNYLILSIMDNVKSRLEFYKFEGGGSSLRLVGGDKEALILSSGVRALDAMEGDKFWFTTSGYTQPSTLSMADASLIESGDADKVEPYVAAELKSLPDQFDASGLDVVQRSATSMDGTIVPYFLVLKAGTEMNGKTPTLLYGYGGFEISLGPHYVPTSGIAWLERGGAYVEANIRGGGEFGPKWHQAALKENRNKAYEDFIAVAEDLIASGLCKPETLAIRGGSNGGLLMGNMYVMRPDLFGAIHCAVPLLDMKRFHTLLAGASWMAEYGDPDTDDWEKFLYKYSPYHNIDRGVEKYPPMLVTTSTRDDRVHPAHARKMVKKLWDMAGEDKDWPIYYYENIEGGHGGAADAKQQAFMTTLAYDFMFETLTTNAGKM